MANQTIGKGGRSEHDFSQARVDWEASVFDSASYFTVTEMRSEPRRVTPFTVFPWAVRFASEREDACLNAVTKSGRFVLLERASWGAWEARWREKRGEAVEVPALAKPKPHRGTIDDWSEHSASEGLGYRIEGRMGNRGVTTTSIIAREGDEVETLNWRYTLGGKRT